MRKPTASTLQKAIDDVDATFMDWSAWYADKSERWQESDKGTDALAALDTLENGLDSLRSALEGLGDL